MVNNKELFDLIIQGIITLCVIALFFSIFLDFALYSKNAKVKKGKKSIVETGTMTLFFFVFYLILKSKLWIIAITNVQLRNSIVIVGVLAIVIGCVINIFGRFNLGSNWGNHIRIYEDHCLVQKGMYKIVRHPLYASIILMFYGACLVHPNIACLIAVSLIFVPFMYYRAKQEETMLMRAFPEYEEYKQRTGMLIPKILKRKGD